MPRRFGIAIVSVLLGLVGGCGPFAKNTVAPSKCTGDPCATMVCPDGMRCSVTSGCAPRCEPMTYRSY